MINALVANDSACVRDTIVRALDSDPEIRISGFAGNGEEALAKTAEARPDVVIMDMEIPVMRGIEVLRLIMREHPLPVVALTSCEQSGPGIILTALEGGAVDFVCKDRLLSFAASADFGQNFVGKVKAAARCNIAAHSALVQQGGDASADKLFSRTPVSEAGYGEIRLVAIGASTGGPVVIRRILQQLPRDFPAGILIVQHMPLVCTGHFAEHLDSLCDISVKEAAHDDRVEPGVALVAPGNRHMTVRHDAGDVHVTLSRRPSSALHRPSIDVLLASVAGIYREAAAGVILSGAGHDGYEGLQMLKEYGGTVIAQKGETCLLSDMPGGVIDAGVADFVVAPDLMAKTLMELSAAPTPAMSGQK